MFLTSHMRSVFAAATVLCALPAFAGGDWVSVDDPDFTAQLPGTPKRTQSVEPSEAGELTNVLFEYNADNGNTYLAVNYTDFPAGLMTQADPGKVLDGARKGALDNTRATSLGTHAVWLEAGGQKFPGTEFEGKTADGLKVSARLFLVNDRLYQLLFIRQFARPADADFKTFTGSFALKGAGRAAKAGGNLKGGGTRAPAPSGPRGPAEHRPAPSRQ